MSRYRFQEQGWASFSGPLGGTVGTLSNLGWIPKGPQRWISQAGVLWDPTDVARRPDLLAAIHEDAISTLWSRAAVHRNGTGLEKGWDHTVYRQLKKRWRNQGKFQQAIL